MNTLVPGRECDACTVCCTALPIETVELRKLPGMTCVHCGAQGCAIYETRFPICRTYHCGWRVLSELDDSWRPDRSGVLVSPQNEDLPERFRKQGGIEFLVLGGEAAIRRDGFAQFVVTCILNDVATFMAVPGPPGYYSARVLLNDRLADAASRRDVAAVRAALLAALAASSAHSFQKMETAGRRL